MEGTSSKKESKVKVYLHRYFIDAMSAMAMGLFASLLIGTILDTLGDQFHWDWLVTAAGYASSATGIAIAVAIGVSLSAPPLVLYSLCAVGLGSYSVGGPLGSFFAVIVAAELGSSPPLSPFFPDLALAPSSVPASAFS